MKAKAKVRCAFCHDSDGDLDECPDCGALLHEDCGPCPTLGCRPAPVGRVTRRPARSPEAEAILQHRDELVGLALALTIMLVVALWILA